MKAAAERSGFAPVKNAEVYGSLAAASFVYRFHFLLGPGQAGVPEDCAAYAAAGAQAPCTPGRNAEMFPE